MKTIFISVPMHGKTPEEINAAINECVDWYCNHYDPTDIQFEHNANYVCSVPLEPGSTAHRCYCLGVAIQKLGQCDGIVMGDGWFDSKGCHVEWETAWNYGIPIFDASKSDDIDLKEETE